MTNLLLAKQAASKALACLQNEKEPAVAVAIASLAQAVASLTSLCKADLPPDAPDTLRATDRHIAQICTLIYNALQPPHTYSYVVWGGRFAELVDYRRVMIWYLCQHGGTRTCIGTYFKKDHSTICNQYDAAKDLVTAKDTSFCTLVDTVLQNVELVEFMRAAGLQDVQVDTHVRPTCWVGLPARLIELATLCKSVLSPGTDMLAFQSLKIENRKHLAYLYVIAYFLLNSGYNGAQVATFFGRRQNRFCKECMKVGRAIREGKGMAADAWKALQESETICNYLKNNANQ